jgi:hypothetical protein
MRLPVLLALGCGVAIFRAGYTDAYFPQNDVFSYYQLFHYTYSSVLLNRQIPLWEPYAGYGIPSAFELAFTFGPTKAAAALIGFLFRITDIKALYFGAVGVDYALIGLAAAWLARDLTGKVGPHVSLAAVLMPLSHPMGTAPNWSYGFALTMLFVLLFLLRFLQTRRGIYLTATGLTLVANIYGNPQYLVIPETYLALLFLLIAGLRFRHQLAAERRSIIRSLFTIPSIVIGALTVGLLIGLLLIDHEILKTVIFTASDRDPQTLKPSLKVFLYYVDLTAFRRLPDLFTGRPITTPDIWLYFGASGLSVLFYALIRGWRIKFVPELLILVLLTTAFSLPVLFPIAKWAYYWAPGMNLYRPASFASIFAKPFAILVVACVLADPAISEEASRRLLFKTTVAVMLCADVLLWLRIPVVFYFDSFAYGWIAIVALLILLVALTVVHGPRWEPCAPLLLAFILGGEVATHRLAFDAVFYRALAQHKMLTGPMDLYTVGHWNPFDASFYDFYVEAFSKVRLSDTIPIEPWYRRPRRLVYRPMRFQPAPYPPVFPFSAHYMQFETIYHGVWSFLGFDPCIPMARSDTYVRWVAEALERHGVVPTDLSAGQVYGSSGEPPYGLGKDFESAYGCDLPKLTIDDPAGKIWMEQFTANEAAISVTTPAGSTLTYRDAWTPAWQAAVDGAPAAVGRNNYGFKTLEVPPGNHRVDLVFRPLAGEKAMLVLAVLLTLTLLAQIWLMQAGPRLSDQPESCPAAPEPEGMC